MKKILVTGATGFVGGAVMDELLRLGMPIIAGVRKQTANLADAVQQVVIGDLSVLEETSFALKRSLFKGVDIVVHTAARVSGVRSYITTSY